MTDLDALIERVRGLKGPNWQVEHDLYKMFDAEAYAAQREQLGIRVPHYTSSLDAVVALAERVLPDGEWWVRRVAKGNIFVKEGVRAIAWAQRSIGADMRRSKGATPALALLLAVLTAVKEKQG